MFFILLIINKLQTYDSIIIYGVLISRYLHYYCSAILG